MTIGSCSGRTVSIRPRRTPSPHQLDEIRPQRSPLLGTQFPARQQRIKPMAEQQLSPVYVANADQYWISTRWRTWENMQTLP
jgi:hypothetical protein